MEVVDNTEDYEITSSFPKQPESSLRHLIEYRIKLLLKDDIFLEAGESQFAATACKITRKPMELCMHLKPSETLPVTFESEGYISSGFRGRVLIKLTNYSGEDRKIPAGTEAGYMILSPFALE
jgi:dUTPase